MDTIAPQQSSTHAALSPESEQRIGASTAEMKVTAISLGSLPLIPTTSDINNTSASAVTSISITGKPRSFRLDVFSTNAARRIPNIALPDSNARIDNTMQLAYCCSVLSKAKKSPSLTSDTDDHQQTPLDDKQQEWASHIDPIIHDRCRLLVDQMVKEFVNNPIKGSNAIAEIILVGPILEEKLYRSLLSCFISESEGSALLDLDLLQGLVQLVECAPHGYLVDNDLVRITTVISKQLSTVHTGNSSLRLYLTWLLSRILDVMVAGKVRDMNRDRDHQLMLQILVSLKESDDLYLRCQAAYAYQALQYVPDDETPLQIVWRYLQGTTQVISAAANISKIDPEGFLDGLEAFSRFCGEVIATGVATYKIANESISSLRQGTEKVVRAAENVSGEIKKYSWYLALQGTALFIRQGKLCDFNKVVCQVPCRNNVNFQWGICRQLGEIIIDPLWDVVVRQQAVVFLGELYRSENDIELHDDVKRWILTILVHITKQGDKSLKEYTLIILDHLKEEKMEDLPGSYPLNTCLPHPTSFPLLLKVQNIPDVEYHLLTLRSQRMKEYIQPVYITPMAKPNLRSPEDTLFALMDKVKEFLSSDKLVMLILGDSGSGKSTFNKHLEYELWKDYRSGNRIPLFINLPGLIHPESNMIPEQLNINGFTEPQIRELQQHRQFILICDGYDESQLKTNLHTTNLLNRTGHSDTKLIITCRSQYLSLDYRIYFVPEAVGQYHRTADNLFEECAIVSFSRTQIEEYVEQYVSIEPRPWTKCEYLIKLETIPKLMGLVSNPFLLRICLDALPNVAQGKSDVTTLQVTRVQLYDNFVEHWLEINKRRLEEAKLENVKRDIFDLLVDDGFVKHGIMYQIRLAGEIFHKQNGRPIVDYSHRRDKDTWKMQFFGPDPERELLRDSSLLSRTGSQYQFVHRSILEYFYSCTLCGPNSEDSVLDWHCNLDLSHTLSSIENHPLSRYDLVKEPSIIRFLAERVYHDPKFKQELLEIIDLSKTNDQATRAAANAITILVKANVRFNGQDLQKIRISGADLSGGQFDSVQLNEADLTNVNLTKIWLRQADLTNTVLTGVYFGELPFLELKEMISSCVYSPDGEKLAVGLESGEILIYDTASWSLVHSFNAHSSVIAGLAYSPCSNVLLTGSHDKMVRLWDCKSASMKFEFEGHDDMVLSVAFSPSGKLVASASSDGALKLWDSESGNLTTTLPNNTEIIQEVAFSPDGMAIASADYGETIRVFDVLTGAEIFAVNCDFSTCIAYSPDGRRFVSGNMSGEIQLWNSDSGSPEQTWKGHSNEVLQVAYAPNGQWIASCGSDEIVKVWNAHSGTHVSSLTGHHNWVVDVKFSPGSLQLASAGGDKTVRIWDLSIIEPGFAEESRRDSIISVQYSLDGQSVISCSRAGDVQEYNVVSGEVVRSIQCGDFQNYQMPISPDNLRVARADLENHVYVWNIFSGTLEFVLEGHKFNVPAIAFSPCGLWIATGSYDNTIRLWDANSGALVRELTGHEEYAKCLQFSPNSQQIISVSNDGAIRIWEVGTDESKKFYAVDHKVDYCGNAFFSPSGLFIAENCSDLSTVSIRDQSRDEPLFVLKHDEWVTCFEWSHCEQWIATACDRTVWLWNNGLEKPVLEWKHILVIHDFHGMVDSIAWKPNSLEFTTGCYDGSVRVWKLVETLDGWSVQQICGTGNSVLAASGASLSKAIGLSPVNRQLLEQCMKGSS